MDLQLHRRGGCLLIVIFALIGMVAGIYTCLLQEPFPTVSVAHPLSPRGNATLEVLFSEQARYIREAPETTAFRVEVAFWVWGLPISIILAGAVGGGLVGYLAERCLRRAPWRINA